MTSGKNAASLAASLGVYTSSTDVDIEIWKKSSIDCKASALCKLQKQVFQPSG